MTNTATPTPSTDMMKTPFLMCSPPVDHMQSVRKAKKKKEETTTWPRLMINCECVVENRTSKNDLSKMPVATHGHGSRNQWGRAGLYSVNSQQFCWKLGERGCSNDIRYGGMGAHYAANNCIIRIHARSIPSESSMSEVSAGAPPLPMLSFRERQLS